MSSENDSDQYGGSDDGELSGSHTLEVDADDDIDPNDDGIYDPINDGDEPIDTDEDIMNSYGSDDYQELSDSLHDENSGELSDDIDDEDEIPISKKHKTKSKKNKCINDNFDTVIEDTSDYGKLEWTVVPDNERKSDPTLTYYEIVRIIGERAQQLSLGATPLINGSETLTSHMIAYLELKYKMIPYIIRRRLPGKTYEDWRIDELEMIHTITDPVYVPSSDQIEHIRKLN